MSDNSLTNALLSMTPPSRLSTPSRIHPKWNQQPHEPTASRTLFAETVVTTPLRAKTPQRSYKTTPKRSNSGEFCGLTAEITRELHHGKSSARKSRMQRQSSEETSSYNMDDSGYVSFHVPGNSRMGVMQTPPRVTRKQEDIFMPKNTALVLAPTVSSSYEDISPKEENVAPSNTATKPSTNTAHRLPPSSSKSKRALSTPVRMKNKLFSAKKIKKCLTPPREGFASHLRQLRSAKKLPSEDDEMDHPPPSPASLSTALPGADEFKIHSTEYDPFDFQCELPSKKEMIVHAKICNVVDSYTSTHLEFNFAMLAGLRRGTLEQEYERSSEMKPMIAGACHRDVVKDILECEDDLVVEGFFREYVGDCDGSSAGKTPAKSKGTPAKNANKPSRDDRIEAVIFSSDKLRQIIVCFRGSTASQAKPLKMNYFGKEGSSLLNEEHQVRVLSAFRDAYFGTPMEEAVFALLTNLTTRKPFFDVVMTGHSFGAALATIGAMRYATSQPMMRVSCHVFGCPRIGGEDWRQLVHSLANLKVFRAENANDSYVLLPGGSEWVQVGHAISIEDTTITSSSEGNGGTTTASNGSSNVRFMARRFDRDRMTSNNGMFDLIKCPKVNLPRGMTQGLTTQKVDHEMKSYVNKLTQSGDRWFTEFSGMNGNGVISFADNERRLLA